MRDILCYLVQLYVLVIFVRVVLSWFPISPGGLMASAHSFVLRLTEPILGPVRRALPPVRIGAMGLDLSPIIVLLFIQIILVRIIC